MNAVRRLARYGSTTYPRVLVAPRTLVASFSTFSQESSSLDALKRRLLQASLDHVAEHGWSMQAIATAAQTEAHVSISTTGLVTVPELIAFAMDQWNERLRLDLLATATTDAKATVNEQIVRALWKRLSYTHDLVRANRWHEGMAVGAHFDSVWTTQRQIAHAIDIVVASIETSQEVPLLSAWDRFSLGGVYVASELHMITDTSVDFGDTRTFLEHRVAEWDTLRSTTKNIFQPPLSSVWQYHSTSDILFTASVLGSALASGVQSIMTNPSPATRREHAARHGQVDPVVHATEGATPNSSDI